MCVNFTHNAQVFTNIYKYANNRSWICIQTLSSNEAFRCHTSYGEFFDVSPKDVDPLEGRY